jgi:hypothetical protein
VRTEYSLEFLALRSAAQLRKIFEERLYLARGLQGSDRPSRPLPDVRPCVRHLARSEDAISRCWLVALLANLDYVFALEDVEPLVLLVVQVPRRTALVERGDLANSETAVRVQGRNLEVDHCSCELDLALPPKPISTCRDVVSRVYLRAFLYHERSFLDTDPGSP